MVLNWLHSRLDLYWIQSGVNLTPEFLQWSHDPPPYSTAPSPVEIMNGPYKLWKFQMRWSATLLST